MAGSAHLKSMWPRRKMAPSVERRVRKLASKYTLAYCEQILRQAPAEVSALYDYFTRKENQMKHIVTAKANHGAAKKGKMRRVSFEPATEGGGGTVSCDHDSDGDMGQYMAPTTTVHESVESAHDKMGEHMGVKKPAPKKK